MFPYLYMFKVLLFTQKIHCFITHTTDYVVEIKEKRQYIHYTHNPFFKNRIAHFYEKEMVL